MSEPREECYKCLNNQSCPSIADYGSVICMTRRKFKMLGNEEDSVYAIKFAVMQKQMAEKEERIKKLEKENRKLRMALNGHLDKNKKACFIEDGHTGKCLGYSFFNDDKPCIYCQTCDAINIKEND